MLIYFDCKLTDNTCNAFKGMLSVTFSVRGMHFVKRVFSATAAVQFYNTNVSQEWTGIPYQIKSYQPLTL